MISIYNSFPREVGPPRKLVYNIKDWLSFINNSNGKKKAVYTSVYSFREIDETGKKPKYETANIDKLFFDFDDKSCDAWKECNTLHQECKKRDIKHTIVMSGRGYHLYIFTKLYNPQYVRSVIYNAQMSFVKELKLNVDRQVIGNPAQLARVPNTYNLRGRRFCIPLTEVDFNKGDIFCKEKALKQNLSKQDMIIGKQLLDLKQFDKIDKEDIEFLESLELESSKNIVIGNLEPCIEKILNNPDMCYNERYLIILYFKEKGYTREEVYKILKEKLSNKKFRHCIFEEKQLQYLFEREDLMFPKCRVIKNMGFCCEKCKEDISKKVYKT